MLVVETTTLSTKGQLILPKTIRDAHGWDAGTRFVVEEAPGGVVLRPLTPGAPSRLEEVAGSAQYHGRPKSLSEMDRAIARQVKERHGRGRY
jgi:AbrB family looped-hinge helix DNA binding protein